MCHESRKNRSTIRMYAQVNKTIVIMGTLICKVLHINNTSGEIYDVGHEGERERETKGEK